MMQHNDRALATIARVLMALLFLLAGIHKATAFAMTVGYFGKLGIPAPEAVAALSIAIEVGGSILLVVGYRLVVVAPVMALFTLGTALIGHQFWAVSDPAVYMAQFNNFMKNIAICGGFLMIVVDARRRRS